MDKNKIVDKDFLERVKRAEDDVLQMKSTGKIGPDSSTLYITTKDMTYNIPPSSSSSWRNPYFLEVLFTADTQLNAFCTLDYFISQNEYFDSIQRKVSVSDSKISRFWAYVVTDGNAKTINVKWIVISTDRGVIT